MQAPARLPDVSLRQYPGFRRDLRGPRYTSYPTALRFETGFGEDRYGSLWSERTGPLSLYVHLPFCQSICHFCACNKIAARRGPRVTEYLDHLEREMHLQAQRVGADRPVLQLHWGGGTPTFLSAAEMTALMHRLATRFRLVDSPAREYAIEIDPRTVDRSTIALLKGLGFNRISLGIQDFDGTVQRAINRVQPLEQICEVVDAVRAHGFRSLGFDLIYGLPCQSRISFEQTVRRVIALAPDRLALYGYAHMPERFSAQRAIDPRTLPGPMARLAMLEMASDMLIRAGYQPIGMDHFALPGDELAVAQREGRLHRNFQGYSVNMAPDVLGLGVSAISSTGNGFAQNACDLQAYAAALGQGRLPVERGFTLDRDDRIRGYVIGEIICNLGCRSEALEQRFGVSFPDYFAAEWPQLEALQRHGLLAIDAAGLRVAEAGRPMLRNICMCFDRYLDLAGAASSTF